MKWKTTPEIKAPLFGEIREKTFFCWTPYEYKGETHWLITLTIRQVFTCLGAVQISDGSHEFWADEGSYWWNSEMSSMKPGTCGEIDRRIQIESGRRLTPDSLRDTLELIDEVLEEP